METEPVESGETRFWFGRNWKQYVEKQFTPERLEVSKKHIMDFLGLENLNDRSFLDIGCGSGLSSFAAFSAGTARLFSFDYDPESVEATRMLRHVAGDPEHWQVTQGSVLDDEFVAGLEEADIVYSWGVLHHTGDQWHAIRNAASKVKPGGLFYIALYTSDVFIDPTPEFWLETKQRYVKGSWLTRRQLEAWYIWRFMAAKRITALPAVAARAARHKFERGMSLYTDIKDWLGGWPMEFSSIAEVKAFASDELGFELLKINSGEANTEYLFARPK